MAEYFKESDLLIKGILSCTVMVTQNIHFWPFGVAQNKNSRSLKQRDLVEKGFFNACTVHCIYKVNLLCFNAKDYQIKSLTYSAISTFILYMVCKSDIGCIIMSKCKPSIYREDRQTDECHACYHSVCSAPIHVVLL